LELLRAAILTGLSNQREESSSALKASLNHLLDYLQSDPPPSIPTVLDELINTVTASAERVLLVLDDYHLIQTPEIHEQMTYLLEHQPPNLHLVIATRADPPLPITRLRARGQLSEFRAADLRFTAAETEAFFRTMTGVAMTGEDLSAVQTSTEGWIAGLQMAALALQAVMSEDAAGSRRVQGESQGKIKAFVDSFSGKHLYILDYLTDEVFNRQPEEIQTFLLKTSILERLSAGLCAAVLRNDNEAENEREDPAVQNQGLAKAKATLDYLEQSNLFLVRLDPERRWFRYHHLFADLLLARLEQTLPAVIPDLHRKASRWYAENGFVDDAIQHALKAEDWAWAAQLMEMHVTTYLELGQLNLILKWIDSLPTRAARRPVLCAQVAEALAHAGRFQRVPPLIEMAETALAAWEGGEEGASALFQTQRDLTARARDYHRAARFWRYSGGKA
jgi:LuxR family transcriptional regulator, maltose regulon positive regulatory protein